MRCFCDGLIILISYMCSFPSPSIFLLPVLLSKAHAPSYIYIYKLSLSIPSLNPCFLRSAWRFLSTPTCRGLCPSQMNQCFSYIIFSMQYALLMTFLVVFFLAAVYYLYSHQEQRLQKIESLSIPVVITKSWYFHFGVSLSLLLCFFFILVTVFLGFTHSSL